MPELTPSQTIGPFFSGALAPAPPARAGIAGNKLVKAPTTSPIIEITGNVLDGLGSPVDDALIEIWQADSNGMFDADPNFSGFGRCATDENGRFNFVTVKPAAEASQLGGQAPYVNVVIFLRGLLTHLFTRIYFSDEESANEADLLLSSIDSERRQTIVGIKQEHNGNPVYRLDIRLQGSQETVFLDYV